MSSSLFCVQQTSRSFTTFGWSSSFNMATSRIAVLGTPSSSSCSFIRFIASTSPVPASFTL
eukprot:CAMPEP_0178992708 /NCGR_PEP_ID=MMETSP0795-20121207/6269_1 /TAXON_ID=88552 /ORGANISM="Amoebophrya sp., Strain Ameob2" /LENGTH=60 /DNA_ID=CAMNT_0020684629 /DNA_START=951 /DNA_END=1133 /DNA_ORIENTATION=+